MLQIKYEGLKKNVPSQWSELTIEDFHNLYQVIYKYEDSDLDKDEVQKLNFIKDYVSFLLKEEMDRVDMMDVKDIEHLVAGTQALLTEYEPKETTSFVFEEQEYRFPVDVRKQCFGEYIEVQALEKSAKLLKNGKFDVVAEQIARLCKKPEEMDTYLDEDIVMERAEKFKKLPMDIVWEFNFFLLRHQGILQKTILIYGEDKVAIMKQRLQENS